MTESTENQRGVPPFFKNHSSNKSLFSFVLIQKKQKIKAVNCLTAGFSSTRHHLNGPSG